MNESLREARPDALRNAIVQAANNNPITAEMAWEVLREWDKRGEAVDRLARTEALLSDVEKKLAVLRPNLTASVSEDEREFWQRHFDALLETIRGN